MPYNFFNIHAGETGIIIGNGPSLKLVPDAFLDMYPNFGTNRIYLRFVPDYYVVINRLVAIQNQSDINAMQTIKFVREKCGLEGVQLHPAESHEFSLAPNLWINEGYTVTYVALQLAYAMGFQTVLLVGVDHRYNFTGKPNQKQLLTGADENHFSGAYFSGQEWQTPDLLNSERYYSVAREVYEKAGRRIINLGPDSALNVFERGELKDWYETDTCTLDG